MLDYTMTYALAGVNHPFVPIFSLLSSWPVQQLLLVE